MIRFDDTEIEENKFHQYKSPLLINNIDINEITVSNKFLFPFGKQDSKYFIGYKELRPLCIFFPETSIYKRHYGKTKWRKTFW